MTKKADLTQKIEILTDKMDETNAPVEEILGKIQEYHGQRLFLQASSHEPAIGIRDNVKSDMMPGSGEPPCRDTWSTEE